jgi:two-component system phosphate regulon sensor histidine kinase PhoR
MILLDLKLALFSIIVPIVVGLVVVWYLARHRKALLRRGPISAWELCEPLPFGVIVVEASGAIAFTNAAARHLLRVIDADPRDAVQQILHQLAHDTTIMTARGGYISKPQPLRWWRYPLPDEHTLLVLSDEREQQQSARQQHAFVGQLAHELRTPLTALLTHTEIARDPRTPQHLRFTSMDTIERETQRMTRLVRDLLELHRLEVAPDFPLQPTDLALVAEDAIAQTILRAEEAGLSITFEADTVLPLVLAQPDRLKQVFLNLLDNATKSCRPGDSIRVHLEAQAEGVRCIVRDTGPGIPAAHLPHITERLYRVQADVEGNGIGLALVSEILRRHNTTLTIESSTQSPVSGTMMSWTLSYATPQPSTA